MRAADQEAKQHRQIRMVREIDVCRALVRARIEIRGRGLS